MEELKTRGKRRASTVEFEINEDDDDNIILDTNDINHPDNDQLQEEELVGCILVDEPNHT